MSLEQLTALTGNMDRLLVLLRDSHSKNEFHVLSNSYYESIREVADRYKVDPRLIRRYTIKYLRIFHRKRFINYARVEQDDADEELFEIAGCSLLIS